MGERRKRLKDVRLVAKRLTARYHDFAHNNRRDPYRELVFILCSTMTQQDVHERVYSNFIRKFPSLEKVAHASLRQLAAALREGGLASRKADQFKAIAKQVRRETGRYDLNGLAELEDDVLEESLQRLPGVGPKVARCVMLYSYARHVFPVDTHCWRTAQRLGWLGKKPGPMTARGVDALQASIPLTLRFSLHVNLVSLGRDVCKAGRPLCGKCVLADICPSSRVKHHRRKRAGKPMSETKLEYNAKDRKSILALAKLLEGKTLGELVPSVHERADYGHKGEFGNLVERLIFGIQPNNRDEPDIPESKVEIKTSPLRNRKRGIVPKERMVLGMIDYESIITEKFDKSKFWSKNACLLILFYLWQQGLDPYRYEFLKSILHEFKDEDLRIIRKDWERIRQKVHAGLAHEISEGDTLYLGACTKSSDSTVRVTQPNSKEPAKPRAFSLKTSYLKVLLEKTGNLVPLKIDSRVTDIEKFVLDELAKYHGWGEKKMIRDLCGRKGATAKNRYRMMINRMLDLPSDAKIEQFEKADVQVKTIRVQKSGKIKESMSFRNIDFFELLKNSEWEESEFYHDVSRRFLFCIFREGLSGTGYGFDTAFFWTMPTRDLDEVHKVWMETRKRAKAGKYTQLPRSKESAVAHVRTKGRNNKDLTKTPNNGLITKRCFWLNRKYIIRLITTQLRS